MTDWLESEKDTDWKGEREGVGVIERVNENVGKRIKRLSKEKYNEK